ncbi:MAG: ABC transporter ATP-binding protein [Acidimicrobiales bacterium]
MLLEVVKLSTGYGDLPVLYDVDLQVEEGEIVAIVGANGAGKTTLLSAVTGLTALWGGKVSFSGGDITRTPAHGLPDLGLVMVPEGRRLFPFMSVEENLRLGSFAPRPRARASTTLSEVYEYFPILAERKTQMAGSMSGGEQQMCAIGRALMARPKLLILDEPSLGLAPVIVERIFDMIRDLSKTGLTVLLVEQNVHDALEMADRGYVLEQGRITMTGTGQELLGRDDLQRAYLGV